MKQTALLAALTALTLGFVSCEKNGPGNKVDNPYKELNLTTKSAEFANNGNDFAFNFIDRVNAAEEGDFFISPLSMQFLLGMILDGAQGATSSEICNVLGYGSGETDAVNEYCRSMMEQLPGLDALTELAIANAIVVNKNYSLLDGYKSSVRTFYDAEVAGKDFSDNAGTTRYINQWCSDHTNGLIPEILKQVNPEMLAYLINAMYFKSQWMAKFDPACTSSEPFTAEGGNRKNVSMMKSVNCFDYRENELFRAVRLPFGNGAFSMSVILPAKGKNLSDITENLNGKAWADFASSMHGCVVNLWLPRFTTSYHIVLNDILSAMGMPLAFDAVNADFKAMSEDALCLSLVQQDAVIKVDEEGTEAAAVSSTVILGAASPDPREPIVFHADHPFLYLITESSSGAILFAGRYCGK